MPKAYQPICRIKPIRPRKFDFSVHCTRPGEVNRKIEFTWPNGFYSAYQPICRIKPIRPRKFDFSVHFTRPGAVNRKIEFTWPNGFYSADRLICFRHLSMSYA